VILVDANILIYAHIEEFPQHVRAKTWLDEQLSGATPVGLPWANIIAFLRITTNRRVFRQPLSIVAAWEQVQQWFSCSNVWTPQPTDRHAHMLEQILLESNVHGEPVADAELAALAMEHGLTLCSADRDFARFPRLRWHNPLTGRTSQPA
jgi:toxin-antitoxin system PIN domain toxin